MAVLRETYQPWRFSELPEDVLHNIKQHVHENGKDMKNMELFYDPDTNYFVFHDRTSDFYNGIAKNWGDKKPTKQLTLDGLKQRPKKPKQAAPVPTEKPKETPVTAKFTPVPHEGSPYSISYHGRSLNKVQVGPTPKSKEIVFKKPKIQFGPVASITWDKPAENTEAEPQKKRFKLRKPYVPKAFRRSAFLQYIQKQQAEDNNPTPKKKPPAEVPA